MGHGSPTADREIVVSRLTDAVRRRNFDEHASLRLTRFREHGLDLLHQSSHEESRQCRGVLITSPST